jgi:mannose-6-phosphate isomerase-like protein (cupin superfamily)
MALPAAPGPPPHIHEDADEAIYVLDGTPEMGIGQQKRTGSAGPVMLGPKGTLHALVNAGSGPVHALVILSPPGYEGFWRETAELRATLGGPSDPEMVLAPQRTYHLAADGQARRFD